MYYLIKISLQCILKVTHRENTPSNKTKAFTKSMNKRIWEIGTLNQLLIRSCYVEIKVVSGKSAFFVIGLFCTRHSICLNLGF